MTSAFKKNRLPAGLAKVRKELPPPGKIFADRKIESRKRVKEKLRRDLQQDPPQR